MDFSDFFKILLTLSHVNLLLLYTDNDSLTNPHGPYDGGSHFLYLYGKMGPEGDYTNESGRVFSPMYTQSAAECTLDLFYYINGNTGEWTDQDGVHQSSLGNIVSLGVDLGISWIDRLTDFLYFLSCLIKI